MEPSPDSPAPVDVAPASAPARRDLYLAWTGFQRRAVSMQEILGFDLHHLPPLQESRWLRPLDYLAQARDTVKLVRSGAYDTIWVQTPPTFLVHLLLALRTRTPFRLITDCHHGALLPPWSRLPGAISLLNRCDVVLMHNSETLEQAAGMGVARDRMVVLEDPPPPDFRAGAGAPGVVPEGPYVLVPCSFKYDEPIPMLMETARAMPELRFLVTGSLKRAEAQGFTAGAARQCHLHRFPGPRGLRCAARQRHRRARADHGGRRPALGGQRGARRGPRAGALRHPRAARDVRRGGIAERQHARGAGRYAARRLRAPRATAGGEFGRFAISGWQPGQASSRTSAALCPRPDCGRTPRNKAVRLDICVNRDVMCP